MVILLVVLVVVLAAVLVYFAFLKKPGEVAVSPTPTATKTATPTPDETANWQVYRDQKFQLSIPPQWHNNPRGLDQLILADNSPYYLSFAAFNLDQFAGDAKTKSLYANGKLLEAERAVVKSLCENTGSCGEIVESKSISVSSGTGIEFIVRYNGLRIDEPRGFSNEIHRTILKDGVLYRFWTSEQMAPDELRNEYPKLNPSPIELFRKIMDTFKTL